MADNTVPNSMFLKNIRCPNCESLAPFEFGPLPVTLKVYDNAIDTIGLVHWCDEDAIRCCKCGHNGVVGDFRTASQQHQITIEIGGSVDVTVNYAGGGTAAWREAVRDAFEQLTQDQITDAITLQGHGPTPKEANNG